MESWDGVKIFQMVSFIIWRTGVPGTWARYGGAFVWVFSLTCNFRRKFGRVSGVVSGASGSDELRKIVAPFIILIFKIPHVVLLH